MGPFRSSLTVHDFKEQDKNKPNLFYYLQTGFLTSVESNGAQ